MSSEFKQESEFAPATDAPPPAQESVTPAEGQEAAPVEAPPAGETEAAAAQTPAAEPEGEPTEPASTEPEETPKVRAQARKVFMDVQKMGGEPAFQAAKSIFDTYFHKTPFEAANELARYPAKFYPLRDVMLTQAVKEYPDAMVAVLRELHPELEIQVGKKGQQPAQSPSPQQQPADNFDAVAYARQTLEDPLASDADKAMARHFLATEQKLDQLPQLEERLSAADEFIGQTKQERVQAAQTKYVDDLVSSVIDKTYRESGLEGSPITIEQFRDLVVTAHGKNPEANARFQQAMDALAKGDTQTALLLKESIMRDGEQIAFSYAKSFSAAHAGRVNSQAQQLTQERPRVIPAGPPPAPQAQTAAPFDENEYAGALRDIKARG
jgi:hypothetical protein